MAAADHSDGGAVLVTGASTGIGRACALELDARGFNVFAGVRKEEDGRRLAEEASDRLAAVRIDVADGASIEAAVAQIGERTAGRGLRGLVNNAGIAVGGPLEFLPLDDVRRQFEVNLIGQLAVTQACMPLLRTGGGRIVNMGSIGGRVPPPFVGPYAASKSAMRALTDSLRQELRPWGIPVSIIEPGTISTPIWDKGAASTDELAEKLPPRAHELYGGAVEAMRKATVRLNKQGIPPERVAKAVAHALTAARPRPRYLVGPDARVQLALSRVLPTRVFDGLVARLLKLPRRT
jgi:NAD(P)-dependent dehydrogenase (short-subunit alcohol dehydrogenase family)